MILEETFRSLVERYTPDRLVAGRLWDEVKTKYSAKGRYYHTLRHLDNMLGHILKWKNELRNFDAILFALYYHDAVYNVLRKNNEEKSSLLAEKRLQALHVEDATMLICKQHILATKAHTLSENADTNFFTDADLSILGQPWQQYEIYIHQIRKEYSIYPDIIYRPGRKKVLEHFLQMPKIFKTDLFFINCEQQARANLEREVRSL